ncbi:Alpha/Beta hydrolase protein [Crucibulum laeve]|uniref:Alpha/Beta hydrolase protein n=1 Tax=Crucibulum laeve TaxID=68775 RepID=A0A5C3M930_9AGAR|nr:Alpha/Beta hydrolase protein [Crucibulum laeve]
MAFLRLGSLVIGWGKECQMVHMLSQQVQKNECFIICMICTFMVSYSTPLTCYFHLIGGVYTMGSGSGSSLSAHAPLRMIKSCSQIVDRVFCVDYRVSSAPPFESANPYPAALIDAIPGYQYLLHTAKFKPDNIIISGDSAGGHLAVALSCYLVQLDDPYLPLPRALILLLPSTDWGCTHDSDPTSSVHRNANSDFVAPFFTSGYTARALLAYLPEDEIRTNAWLSPSSLELSSPKGLFTGMPPTCIISGGAEHTVDPMRTLRDRIVADTNMENVLYLEYEDAVHDFLIFTFHEPERSQAPSGDCYLACKCHVASVCLLY